MEYDIIIIGTTIDRITSAIYATKMGKKVLIIESNKLKEYVLSFEEVKDFTLKKYVSIERWKDEIISYGGTIKDEEIIEIKNNEIITDKGTYKAKTIIIAIGARHQLVGLSNEKKYFGNGIHFCVKCDGPFYKDEIGCVVGGNNYALENALKLSEICKEVIIVEEQDKFNADKTLMNEICNKHNIKIYFNTKVTELMGDRRLRKIVLNNNQAINVDCIFIGTGFIPNTDVIKIDENEKNVFIVDKKMQEKEDDDGISIAKKIIEYLDKLK